MNSYDFKVFELANPLQKFCNHRLVGFLRFSWPYECLGHACLDRLSALPRAIGRISGRMLIRRIIRISVYEDADQEPIERALPALTRTKRTGSLKPRSVASSLNRVRPVSASRASGSASTASDMIPSPPRHW